MVLATKSRCDECRLGDEALIRIATRSPIVSQLYEKASGFSRFREICLHLPVNSRVCRWHVMCSFPARRLGMLHSQIRAWMTSAPPIIGPKESVRRARALLGSTQAVELLVIDNG